MGLLSDQATAFLDTYEGQVLNVPSRPALREMARAVACHFTLKDSVSKHAAKTGKRLQIQYCCDEEVISNYAQLKQKLAEAPKGHTSIGLYG